MASKQSTGIQNLLVVYDNALSASYLLEKAAQLAGDDTVVHVIQVIHEGIAEIGIAAIDDSTKLKSFILESAETALEEQLENARSRFSRLESATLWNARKWEGILHAAADAEADLILKATDEHHGVGERLERVMRTPDEWNLLRHAPMPVMLVKPYSWGERPLVLCALDVFDEAHEALNQRILKQASQLAVGLAGELDVVCAYPLFEPWVGELGAVQSYTEIKESVESEIRERANVITAKAGVEMRFLHIDEGQTAAVLGRLVEDTEAALLVLGTHAWEGVRGVLLGNTSERILHNIGTDVLTVPAA